MVPRVDGGGYMAALLGFTKFTLNIICHFTINMRVKRLLPLVATLMLALFAFASSHTLLEGLGLIHHEVAHSEVPANSDSNHELADGKCQFNSSRSEIQKLSAHGSFDLAEILALACVSQLEYLSGQASVEITSSPPPELGTSWQFSSRAALPVRAPSLAS